MVLDRVAGVGGPRGRPAGPGCQRAGHRALTGPDPGRSAPRRVLREGASSGGPAGAAGLRGGEWARGGVEGSGRGDPPGIGLPDRTARPRRGRALP